METKGLINKTLPSAFILFLTFSPNASGVTWRAQWIIHQTVIARKHADIIFRKTIELHTKPEKFIIRLSEDSHYRLSVNGNYVLREPAREDLSQWFYETVGIAPYMKSGRNTLAAEVVNWRPKRSFTFFSQMTLKQVSGPIRSVTPYKILNMDKKSHFIFNFKPFIRHRTYAKTETVPIVFFRQILMQLSNFFIGVLISVKNSQRLI